MRNHFSLEMYCTRWVVDNLYTQYARSCLIFNKKRRWFHLKTSKCRITYFTWVNHIRFIYVKEVTRYLKNVFCYAPYDAKFKELCQDCVIVVDSAYYRPMPFIWSLHQCVICIFCPAWSSFFRNCGQLISGMGITHRSYTLTKCIKAKSMAMTLLVVSLHLQKYSVQDDIQIILR